MIAVIADDFTGAAEIGGVGLKYGLKVLIETRVNDESDADLLIIATDTRSLPEKEASREIAEITERLLKYKPQLIYKKLDSVLRGNIGPELAVQMRVTGKKRAVVIAGNPFFGRIINNGIYTINSVPLEETHFANDPDFPVKSSSVQKILTNNEIEVFSKSVQEVLPEKGLIIGDVTNHVDMLNWAEKIDNTTAVAGGSGFFDILLGHKFVKNPYPSHGEIHTGNRAMFVFGSSFPKSEDTIKRFSGVGVTIKNMPEEIYRNKEYDSTHFEDWLNEIVENINKNKNVVISVNYNYSSEEKLAARIKKTISNLVKRVMQETQLSDLLIEGGATTSEILGALNIAKLYPVKELDFGIIQMKVKEYPELIITTKPGSYSWPNNLIFDNMN